MKNEFSEKVAQNAEILELRKALRNANITIAKTQRKTSESIEAIYRAAKDASLSVGGNKEIIKYKKILGSSAEVALVHATDWQLGKRTVDYGVDVCRKRVEQFTQKIISLTEIQRAHHPVNNCVVFLGGDMVEGVNIFPGQVYEIDAYLYIQLFETANLIQSMLQTLAHNFANIKVVCEYGNHGRLGKKGEMPTGDNIDCIVYKIVQDRMKDYANISWQMSDDWYQIAVIGKYSALLIHGDEINSFGGQTPAAGILRKCNSWATGVIEPFRDVYMGHWHTPMTLTMSNSGRVFVTGSTESHSNYAKAFIGAVGQPSQRLHYIDPKKGRVTAEYTVWLD